MIVRNEGHQLRDCLSPVADLFDDIVVVDTGSGDDSRDVARRQGASVYDFPWCDDFSAARNESLKQARGEWVFWLDADDRILPPNVERLRGLLDGLSDDPKAFLMDTVMHLGEQARDRERVTSHLRLFRRDPRLSWSRRVHEGLTPWPTALGHEPVFTDIRIDHLGYQDAGLAQRKMRRNMRLLQMEFAVAPEDPCVLMDLANAYAQLGKLSESRRCLRAVISRSDCRPLLLRRAYTALAELENTEGNFRASSQVLERALQRFPNDEYLLYMQSEALYNLGYYALAKAKLIKILWQQPEKNTFQVGAPGDIRQRLARLALGEVLRVEPALAEAEEVLRGVVNDFPADASAWFFLGRVYVDWRAWTKVNEVVSHLSECANGGVFAGLLMAWSQFTRGEWPAVEATLDGLIPQAPYMTLLRVLRAECLHRRGAPQAAQIHACRDILRLQPCNRRAQQILAHLQPRGQEVVVSDPAILGTSVIVDMGVGVTEAVAR
jgi:glycosyltransferase involved in cell wall biosynthesis